MAFENVRFYFFVRKSSDVRQLRENRLVFQNRQYGGLLNVSNGISIIRTNVMLIQ